jgi:hypothetical protein
VRWGCSCGIDGKIHNKNGKQSAPICNFDGGFPRNSTYFLVVTGEALLCLFNEGAGLLLGRANHGTCYGVGGGLHGVDLGSRVKMPLT